MKILKPEYYDQFTCIADKCRHNCCIGWEIDIDDEAMEKYSSVTGEFSERLKDNISLEGTPHFILAENDRCPFLNEKNLCDIITTLGNDHLCEICSEHPRFYNVYSSFAECGLGLSCEEAARIIITSDAPFSVSSDEEIDFQSLTEAEKDFFAIRDEVFSVLGNKEKPLYIKVEELLDTMNITLGDLYSHEWAEELSQFEILDEEWVSCLEDLASFRRNGQFPLEEYEKEFENLLYYFIYRHLPGCLYDGCLNERIAFSVISMQIIYRICVARHMRGDFDIDDLIEVSRMYSSEIEYSEENTEKLLDILFEVI